MNFKIAPRPSVIRLSVCVVAQHEHPVFDAESVLECVFR